MKNSHLFCNLLYNLVRETDSEQSMYVSHGGKLDVSPCGEGINIHAFFYTFVKSSIVFEIIIVVALNKSLYFPPFFLLFCCASEEIPAKLFMYF